MKSLSQVCAWLTFLLGTTIKRPESAKYSSMVAAEEMETGIPLKRNAYNTAEVINRPVLEHAIYQLNQVSAEDSSPDSTSTGPLDSVRNLCMVAVEETRTTSKPLKIAKGLALALLPLHALKRKK